MRSLLYLLLLYQKTQLYESMEMWFYLLMGIAQRYEPHMRTLPCQEYVKKHIVNMSFNCDLQAVSK